LNKEQSAFYRRDKLQQEITLHDSTSKTKMLPNQYTMNTNVKSNETDRQLLTNTLVLNSTTREETSMIVEKKTTVKQKGKKRGDK
jgi:hypothetical protein